MKTFRTPKGTELPLESIRGKDYLSVQNRILWFNEEKDGWKIETNIVHLDNEKATMMAVIKDPQGIIVRQAHKSEDKAGFPDFMEKAETGAIGRALGFLGYGTAYALELEEGERIVDSPRSSKDFSPTKELKKVLSNSSQEENHEEKNPLERFDKIDATDFGAYIAKGGKFEGRAIKDIDQKGLKNYVDYLKQSSYGGKKMSSITNEFIEYAEAYLASLNLLK